jgi:uncharacterized protein (DUF433 family)
MANTTSPTIEDRLQLLEDRLRRLETKLTVLHELPESIRALGGSPGSYAIILVGPGPLDEGIVERVLGPRPSKEQEPQMETPVEPWKHLVARKHPWRKQLFLKGRNMTVRQLVGGIKANSLTEEQAAASYDLPIEAIREALVYFEANPEVIALDAAYERYLEKLRGRGRGPESLPR